MKYIFYFEHVKAYTDKVNSQMNLPQNEWNGILKSNLFRDWYSAWYYRFLRTSCLNTYIKDQISDYTICRHQLKQLFYTKSESESEAFKTFGAWITFKSVIRPQNNSPQSRQYYNLQFQKKKVQSAVVICNYFFLSYFVFLLQLEYFTSQFSSQQYFCQTTYSQAP